MDIYQQLLSALRATCPPAELDIAGSEERSKGLTELQDLIGELPSSVTNWFQSPMPIQISWLRPYSAARAAEFYRNAEPVHDELVYEPIFARRGLCVRDFLPIAKGINGELAVCLVDPVPWVSYNTLGWPDMPLLVDDGPHQRVEPLQPGPTMPVLVSTLTAAILEKRLVWNAERQQMTVSDGDPENPWSDYPWGWHPLMPLPGR